MKNSTLEATAPLLFTITQEHVKKAKRQHVNYCVISEAVKDELELLGAGISAVKTGTTIAHVYLTDGRSIRYWLTPELRKTLIAWDNGHLWPKDLIGIQLALLPIPASQTLAAKRNKAKRVDHGPHAHKRTGRMGEKHLLTRRTIATIARARFNRSVDASILGIKKKAA